MTIDSPAKINWTLRVGPKRADGFHSVHTALVALSLCDRLTLDWDEDVAPGTVRLSIDGPAASADIPLDGRNLVLKAIAALPETRRRELAARASGLHLHLHKNIPSQAGLGGQLQRRRGARRLWRLCGWEPGSGDLYAALDAIGSDCAFFGRLLHEGGAPMAWFEGRGETPVAELAWGGTLPWFAVITPPVACATGAVYGALAHPRTPLAGGVPADWRAQRCNDLQAAALAAFPELAVWQRGLEGAAPNDLQLCGSGASVYTWYADEAAARAGEPILTERLEALPGKPRLVWCGPALGGSGATGDPSVG
ncbi:MAG: hypothetical protein R3E96_12145 [Planctomycetota bacterium]